MTIAPEVERALLRSDPVVALESSLVAHGLPGNAGAEAARDAERRVREGGAVPATIAVIDGTVHVGVDDVVLDRLAGAHDVRKIGPRDLAAGVVSGRWGGTTVAGTLAVCQLAGIHFMATGGIGGAHRGWRLTGNISADLFELARTSVCVVCSGVKSLLDVPATLEMLESRGVPVIGYRCDRFPLFYVPESPYPVSDRLDDPGLIADVAAAHWGFARSTGLVVAQPVAAEVALEPGEVDTAIDEAIAEAERLEVNGQAVTPYVLGRLHEATGGRSVAANVRLVADNAELAAQVACAYYAE